MLLLNEESIQKVFTMRDTIEADKMAFRIFSEGKCVVPLRTNLSIPKYEASNLYMPCYVEELDAAGVKIVSNFPHNAEKGLPTTPGTMILVDATTGEISCILDGTYITKIRTGAATGAATELLACSDAKIGALFGTGGQASAQLEAMLVARKLKEIRIFSPNLEHCKKFLDQAQKKFSQYDTTLRIAKTPSEAVMDADVITTVTRSREPVFDGHLLKDGAHINAIGCFTPDTRELDDITLQRASKIYFDSQKAVLAEAGDMIIPLRRGVITNAKFTGDIGAVITGGIKGRENEKEITVFKSVGIGVMDVIAAAQVYKKAAAQGIGQQFDF